MILTDTFHDRLLKAIDTKSDETVYKLLPSWQEGLLDAAVREYRQDDIDMIVDYLSTQINNKQWADIDASILLAEIVVDVGQQYQHIPHLALGKMLLGDSIGIQGKHFQRAWDLQGEAGDLFCEIDDQIGWARTRTGRLGICIEVGEISIGLEEGYSAEKILLDNKKHVFLLRLKTNLSKALNHTGRYRETVKEYLDLKSSFEKYADSAPHLVAAFYNNVGNAYWYLGDISNSIELFTLAKNEFFNANYLDASRIAKLNLIGAQRALGRYDHALAELYSLLSEYDTTFNIYVLRAKIEIVESCIAINRFQEALIQIKNIEGKLFELEEGAFSDRGQLYRFKAEAYIGLLEYDFAFIALTQAKTFFDSISAETWLADCDYQMGVIKFKQREFHASLEFTQAAATYFKGQDHHSAFVKCCLLLAEAYTALKQNSEALKLAQQALSITRQLQLPTQRLHAHTICAKIFNALNQKGDSKRHYLAAFAILKYLRRRLTLTIANDYLSGKDEVFHGLMTHFINEGNKIKALELLETNRTFAISDYIFSRDRVIWRKGDFESNEMRSQLESLREQQGFLYKQTHERSLLKPDQIAISNPDEAAKRLNNVENQIQKTLEALYLRSAQATNFSPQESIKVDQIKQTLGPNEAVLIYYFRDGGLLYLLTNNEIQQVQLNISSERLSREIDRLRFVMVCATQSISNSQTVTQLRAVSDRICKSLFKFLLDPVWELIQNIKSLTVLPYGPLHSLPFNLLLSPQGYLIETHEIVLAPSFHFIGRPIKSKAQNGIVITDDRNGLLHRTNTEGDLIANLLKIDTVLHNKDADLQILGNKEGEILHIAAHGEHRQDHPQHSFLELNGNQFYVDDLLQENLNFNLVTLSGCETGVVIPQNHEILLGLTQAALMAGAGAVLASFWRVEDTITNEWMEIFYQKLLDGSSKTLSLKSAQTYFINQYPELHPAYWGAFQLFGSPEPLSIHTM